ncbi:hypothetical protein [Streptomyces sp. 16-176A]|uniref:hypothetical protein n=1 Tax=Streptomyces sp. 16-176A TaxID=2530458 RepID=UPI00345C6B12
MAGGITAWFVSRDDSPDFCRALAKDNRVRSLLAATHQAGTDCAALGDTFKKAALREGEEKHSVRQAQAMKDALLAVDDRMRKSGTASLDEELSVPLAEAVADYADDVYGILAPANLDYSKHDSPSDPPWVDAAGAHMSVFQRSLIRVVRGMSVSPSAYAALRMGVTRSAAHALVTTPESAINAADYSGAEGPSAPKANAWVLGALDAIADDVTGDLAKERAADWRKRAFARLTQDAAVSDAPYGSARERDIVIAWQNAVRSAGGDDLDTRLRGQGPVLVKAWGEGIRLDEKKISALSDEARFSAESARGTWSHDLG